MKVVALQAGFHGGSLRQPGEEFEVEDGAKAAWFASAEGAAPKPKAKKESKPEPTTLSELGSSHGKTMTDVLA